VRRKNRISQTIPLALLLATLHEVILFCQEEVELQ
jgi:hypothetical protein